MANLIAQGGPERAPSPGLFGWNRSRMRLPSGR